MSHLTSWPLADLYKLATSLEDMAFTKAAGSQVRWLPCPENPFWDGHSLKSPAALQKEYLTILSKLRCFCTNELPGPHNEAYEYIYLYI